VAGTDADVLRERALRAAVAVAEEKGLRFSKPAVLANASNLLVHLRPAPVVARVPTTIAAVRPGTAWFAREVAVAGHLARCGAPVVAPSAEIDPGPHVHDGLPVTLWALVEATGGALDARAAGRALHTCHEALADFPGVLPDHAIFREARAILARLDAAGALEPADAALARRDGARLAARIDALDVPLQAIHGDAHLGNVIQTARGPLWNDWEDAFRGPRAWDLACLHAAARAFGQAPEPVATAQAGYGDDPDPDLLDLLVDARVYAGLAWTLVYAPHRADGRARVAARLAWLRARENPA
jgi:aminoglycoside phosphotransferase (APT) family kinase protein